MAGLPILQGVAPAPDIYARALSAAYRLQFRIIDPDFSQQKEFDVWEKLRRDGKVSQAINQRTAAVAGSHWTIQPAGDREEEIFLADVIKQAFEEIRDFREARKQLAMGVFRGRSYAWIEGERRTLDLGDGALRNWWVPTNFVNIDKRRVQIVPEREEIRPGSGVYRIRTRKEIWSPANEKYVELLPVDFDALLELVYDDEEGRLGYGRGLIEALYFLWWAKQIILKEGLQGLERWAQGVVVGKLNSFRAGKLGKDPESRRAAMEASLVKQRSKHVFTCDKEDEIEFINGGGEGHEMVRNFLEYCDQGILSVALGSVLPFGSASDVGSLARAETESDTSEQVLQYDREKLGEVLTNSVVRLFLKVNQCHIADLGLMNLRCPKFVTTQQKKEDKEVNARVISTALGSGISLRKDEVYEKIGFTPPAEDDDVIEGRSPMDLFGGSAGGSPGRVPLEQNAVG